MATKRIGLAILAFLVASLFEGNANRGRRRNGQDPFEIYKQRSSMSDVATMLMALSAAVMKADGSGTLEAVATDNNIEDNTYMIVRTNTLL